MCIVLESSGKAISVPVSTMGKPGMLKFAAERIFSFMSGKGSVFCPGEELSAGVFTVFSKDWLLSLDEKSIPLRYSATSTGISFILKSIKNFCTESFPSGL